MNRQYRYILFILIAFLALPARLEAEPKMIPARSIAIHGKPKYGDSFKHFDYVNPNAPKNGSAVFHAIGTWDNFHRYAQRGLAAAGSEDLYDSLLAGSSDEVDSYYPLIAEKFEYAEDYSSIIFYINPKARTHSGKPIEAEDVVFSFNTFYEKGVPQFKAYYEGTNVRALDRYRVRFDLPEGGDKEKLFGLGGTKILARSWWKGKDFSEPQTSPPEGTGPYRFGEYRMGQSVSLELVEDYWAKDLPVNKGRNNFKKIRYDYYRDDTVAFEAFKAGEYDYREENVAMQWATGYTGPAFDSGKLIREEVPHSIPQGMQAFVFNTDRPMFSDWRVRRAIGYAMDFPWMNKNLFYGQYTRTRSYFQNTIYEAKGLPSKEELAVLKPLQGKIPAEIFTEEYQPPSTDGSGNIRSQTRAALALFKEAGWELKNQKLVHSQSGQPMAFELLIYSPSFERISIPIQENLKKFGIDMKIRMVDTTQFTNRLRSRDFDLISNGYGANYYPSSSLNFSWHSAYIDSTWNTAGVKDPAVDYLIEGILERQEKDEELIVWGRALDRVLTWNHYVIPQWHLSMFRLAYNIKFKKPAIRPQYAVGLDTWWIP